MKLRREVKVGIFALLTLAALYWGINFIRGKDLFNKYNNYYAVYEQVNDIHKSTAIYIKGFKVGSVSNIEYAETNPDKFVIEMNVLSKYEVPDNSKARMISTGFMRSKAIELEIGDSPRHMKNRDTLRSEMELDLLAKAGPEMEVLKQKVYGLMNDLTLTLNNINLVIDQNADNIASSISNIENITTTLNQMTTGEGEESIKGILTNLNSISQTLNNRAESIDGIITNVEEFTDSLRSADIATTINNLSATLEEVNLALATINSGEGSLGKLMKDEELYGSLTDASKNLSILLYDLKNNPERYVHFSLFGRKKQDD